MNKQAEMGGVGPWSEAWGVERPLLWPLGPGRKFETALADVTQSLWSACDIHVSSNETAAGRGGAEGRVGRRACRNVRSEITSAEAGSQKQDEKTTKKA